MSEIFKSKKHMMTKLFIYQVAMSLLGLFVVSPFNGITQIAAAVFSTLFFFSLVCYAVIEDGQKDCVAVKAGRAEGKAYTGLLYSSIVYIPTILVVLIQMILCLLTDVLQLSGIKAIFSFLIRFFLMGMYLGFDTGLAQRYYDPVLQKSVSNANKVVLFMSDNYIIFALLLLIFPVVCGIAYYLAYIGKIHVNTEVKNKK